MGKSDSQGRPAKYLRVLASLSPANARWTHLRVFFSDFSSPW